MSKTSPTASRPTRYSLVEQPNDFSLISDIEINDYERNVLLLNAHKKIEDRVKTQQSLDPGTASKLQHSVVFYSNLATTGFRENLKPGKSSRMSLPNLMAKSYLSKDASLKKKQKRKVVTNNTIFEDEIDNFEQNHCNHNDSLDCTYTVTSPPSKFYKQNCDPYDKVKTPDDKSVAASVINPSPKIVSGRNFMRRTKGQKQKAPQPPTVKPLDSDSNRFEILNGSFKHWDINSSSIYDDCVISSKGYKGAQQTKESSTGSSQPSHEELKQRRLSPPYQIVINKHGDEVEYALPYIEQEADINDEPAPNRTMNSAKFETIINDNFAFLNSKHMMDDSLLNHRIVDTIENGQLSMIEPIETFMERRSAKDVVVTDLDKSIDGLLSE